MKNLLLFGTGFLQVFLISAQTWFISKSNYMFILVGGFLISFVWTINVKKIAFGNWPGRIIYSVGASIGALSGIFLAKIFTGN